MSEVQIGTPTEHLLLVAESGWGAHEALIATLKSEGLTATARVVHLPGTAAGPHEFFVSLEQEWRGWEGSRTWESLEGDLAIEARHQFGHVRLTVTLRTQRTDWGNDGWTVTTDFKIDPGEQLSQIVREMAELAGGQE